MLRERAAIPIAHSASLNEDPSEPISVNVASSAKAQLMKCAETISDFSLKRLIQPRTVVAGREILKAIFLYPEPWDFSVRANPITLASSTRRTSR